LIDKDQIHYLTSGNTEQTLRPPVRMRVSRQLVPEASGYRYPVAPPVRMRISRRQPQSVIHSAASESRGKDNQQMTVRKHDPDTTYGNLLLSLPDNPL